jgi:hypothetical protein
VDQRQAAVNTPTKQKARRKAGFFRHECYFHPFPTNVSSLTQTNKLAMQAYLAPQAARSEAERIEQRGPAWLRV